MAVKCVHCGGEHDETALFCALTGRPIDASSASPSDSPSPTPPPLPPPTPPPLPPPAPAAEPPVAASTEIPVGARSISDEKGVFDLLKQAVDLYRKHARAFLITAAVLFLPASFVNSCAVSMITGPVLNASGGDRLRARAEVMARMEKQIARTDDPQTREALLRQLARELEPLADDLPSFGARLASTSAFFLALVGWAVTALILYGSVVPLTGAALTIAVADRILGGNATWREHWMLLFRRLVTLLTAIIPAALVVMVGFFCMVLPGIIASFFFTFVAPVALIENVGGTAALKRSYELVRSDWLRTALMLIVFGILNAIAHRVADVFIPSGSVFFGTFLGDVLLLLVMPVPIIGVVLLYFDLRRKRDGFTDDKLRAELEALRS
jgi:hypothetical protein